MSCMVAPIQGGDPRREIFPIQEAAMDAMKAAAEPDLLALLGVSSFDVLAAGTARYVGAALRPDGAPFYLVLVAPTLDLANPVGSWKGAFFAPFGVADVVGTVEGQLQAPGALPTTITVHSQLLLDAGGNPQAAAGQRTPRARVDWVVAGNQATRPNKAALIDSVTIHDPGPHDPADIRRCVALHAPARIFGEPRAIIAMQCGVAAAALLEAIC